MSGEHKWCDVHLCPGQTMVALLAPISISPSIMCKLCRLCAERCWWKLARLDGGEDPTPGLRPHASFNEIMWERRDQPDMGLCFMLSKRCCMFWTDKKRRAYRRQGSRLPRLCFQWPLFQANAEPAVGTPVLFHLKLNTLQRASYFPKMNSTLWWGKLNTSSHFPILPRQLLPVPLCHVDANPLQ